LYVSHGFTFEWAALLGYWRHRQFYRETGRPIEGGRMTEQGIMFACPYCGQPGHVVWDDDGANRRLISLSNGFHIEEGRIAGARHIIICDVCDEIDPLRTYP
jgi:hypothetical protein